MTSVQRKLWNGAETEAPKVAVTHAGVGRRMTPPHPDAPARWMPRILSRLRTLIETGRRFQTARTFFCALGRIWPVLRSITLGRTGITAKDSQVNEIEEIVIRLAMTIFRPYNVDRGAIWRSHLQDNTLMRAKEL